MKPRSLSCGPKKQFNRILRFNDKASHPQALKNESASVLLLDRLSLQSKTL